MQCCDLPRIKSKHPTAEVRCPTFSTMRVPMPSMLEHKDSYEVNQEPCYRHRQQALMVHIRRF